MADRLQRHPDIVPFDYSWRSLQKARESTHLDQLTYMSLLGRLHGSGYALSQKIRTQGLVSVRPDELMHKLIVNLHQFGSLHGQPPAELAAYRDGFIDALTLQRINPESTS